MGLRNRLLDVIVQLPSQKNKSYGLEIRGWKKLTVEATFRA